jgi:hypothetical protein
VHGWWGVGALLIPEERDGDAGFRLLRPFSHVLIPNESLGAPSWAALEAILVDQGWVAATAIDTAPIRANAEEQIFEPAVELRGVIRAAPEVTDGTWQPLLDVLHRLGGPRYGGDLLTGVVLVIDPLPAESTRP